MQQRMDEIAQENTEIKQRLVERDRSYAMKDAFTRVTNKHPDFMEVVGSKEFKEFGMSLPRAVREAFENRESPDDEIHIMVLDSFKEKYANSQKPNAKTEYVKSQGIAPRARQTQSGSGSDGSNDPGERAFLESLAHAKKIRSN